MAVIEFELTKEFRDRFQEALDQRDDQFIRATLEDVKAADVSSLLYEFNSEESKYVMDLLPIERQAEIINDLDEDTRREFLKIYNSSEIAAFVNLLDSDDAADIINELPIQQREEVLSGLDTELRIQVTELLRYEDNVAGGLMAKELIKARADWTVVQCIEEIRKQAERSPPSTRCTSLTTLTACWDAYLFRTSLFLMPINSLPIYTRRISFA